MGYHAKMGHDDRHRNQEHWMSDEARVLVGTIAFGLGINKATVRAVIHLSLPKSIEQYYQEAGRAGRDGQPADCIMLWRKQDAGLLGFFANKIADAAERDRAWQRYHSIRGFVDSDRCRHRQICIHFGETPQWDSCGACDVCGSAPEWLSEDVALSRAVPHRFTPDKPAANAGKGSQEFTERTAMSAVEVDPDLRDYVREWRRTTAKEQNVAAFVVLHDTTMEEICRIGPSSIAQLRTITGIGERKAETYGQGILDALARYRGGARAAARPEKKTAPALETLRMLREGHTFEDIAKARERQLATVVNTVATLVERGDLEFQPDWIDRNKLAVIEAACARLGVERLKNLKDALPPEITYDEIRLVVARVRREQSVNKSAISA